MTTRTVTESELKQEFGEEWRDNYTNKEACEKFETDILIIQYENSKLCRANSTTGSEGGERNETD